MYDDNDSNLMNEFKNWFYNNFWDNLTIFLLVMFICGILFGSCGVLVCSEDCEEKSVYRTNQRDTEVQKEKPIINTETTETKKHFKDTGTYKYVLFVPELVSGKFYLNSYSFDSYNNISFVDVEIDKHFLIKGNYFLREDNHVGTQQ